MTEGRMCRIIGVCQRVDEGGFHANCRFDERRRFYNVFERRFVGVFHSFVEPLEFLILDQKFQTSLTREFECPYQGVCG
jgi:hypothetical protein